MSIKDISELDMQKYSGFHTCENIEGSVFYIILHDKRWWWPNKTLAYPKTGYGTEMTIRNQLEKYFR